MSQTTNEPGFDTGTPIPPPRPPWWRRKLFIIPASGLALILAASIGAAAAGGGSRTGSASQRPATPAGIYANANQIVQALKAHHVPVTNVVADSGFWSGEGATSGVWATTAPGDSAAVFGGSDNPVQDTEIVVFQNHAKAVAYANLSTDPSAGDPDPDHQTILGTNWAVDAATPAAPGLRAALGGTLIPNVPASTAPAAPSAPAKPKPAAAYPAEAADKALCATFNAGDTASIQAALDQAGGSVSPGLAKDVQAALDGSSYSQDVTAQIHVHMDCALVSVGKAPPAQGFSGSTSSQPSSAPATDPAPGATGAPVFHEKTLLTLSGNGSEDTAPFTIPDGSGNWKIIWTYNEGGFGQSVNFQIWSEDFQADVNKLGTVGSGTEYVYGDPGTHHLTVNSEGAWTIKVVTAP